MRYITCLFLLFCSFPLAADPYVGQFAAQSQDGYYRLTLKKNPDGGYTGTMRSDGVTGQVSGRLQGDRIKGKVGEGDNVYPFVIAAQPDGSLYYQDALGSLLLFHPDTAPAAGAGQKK